MKFSGKNKGYIMILAAVAAVIAIAGAAWGISYIADTYIKPVNPGPITEGNAPKIKIPSFDKIKDSINLKSSPEGNTNLMLLGISGEDYISGNLADTIIFATMNRITK